MSEKEIGSEWGYKIANSFRQQIINEIEYAKKMGASDSYITGFINSIEKSILSCLDTEKEMNWLHI